MLANSRFGIKAAYITRCLKRSGNLSFHTSGCSSVSMIGQNAFGIEGQCCKLSWSSCHLLRTYTGDGIGSIQPVLQPVFVTFKDGEAHLLIDSVSSNFNNYRRQQNRDLGTGLRSRSKQASTDGLERRGAERYAIFP